MNKLVSNIVICLLFITAVYDGSAQLVQQYTQHTFSQMFFNPAYAGISRSGEVQTNLRSQYSGYNSNLYDGGKNQSLFFSASVPVFALKGGLGLAISQNQYSQSLQKQELRLAYSFHKRINSSTVGIGVGGGFNILKPSYSNYIPRDGEDPLLQAQNQSFLASSLDVGVFINNPIYQLGFSVKDVLGAKYTISESGVINENRIFVLQAKYDYSLSASLDLSPTLMVRSDLESFYPEIGLIGTWNQTYWAGFNYRLSDAISGMLGMNMYNNKIKLGYAFDFVSSGSETKAATSHEIFVRYTFATRRLGKRSIIRTPRYNF
ncbi:MAG: PorP/SprF family type IX secretion system membrane protein [Leadbetterella sp.]